MTPTLRKKGPSIRRRKRRPTPKAVTLSAEQLGQLWADYLRNRGDLSLRNRLVE